MNNRKRWVQIMAGGMAAIMLLGCLPAMAEAGTFTANADKHMITAYKGEDENLVVPASVDGVPTPIINWQTINGAKKAVTLTLEEGITQIRSNNIASLNITQLTLPSTLEVIANNNIYQTDKLTEVTVPAAVSYVGTLTFSYCDVLTKVTFTGLCPVFGPRTFVSTAKDLVVYVPDDQLDAYKAALPEGLNIQSSGKNAVDARVRVSESDFEFDAATGTIKKYNGTASYIEIPATIGGVQVKTIGQKAFYQHPYMTVVIIPEGVETLEMYSIFAGSGLYRVELPSTLKTIGNNALWGAELDSVKLPEGLEKIGDGAFTNGMYSKVEELIIPDSVTSIGKEAFKGCTPIKIIIGANVQSLSEGAFGALNYVEEVVIRNTNGMTIDPKAFQSSKKGATITLMDGITEEVYNSYVEQLAVAYENATVNQPELAAAFPTLDALCAASVEDIEEIVKPCGLFHTKAKDISGMCRQIRDRFGGTVPDSMTTAPALWIWTATRPPAAGTWRMARPSLRPSWRRAVSPCLRRPCPSPWTRTAACALTWAASSC